MWFSYVSYEFIPSFGWVYHFGFVLTFCFGQNELQYAVELGWVKQVKSLTWITVINSAAKSMIASAPHDEIASKSA